MLRLDLCSIRIKLVFFCLLSFFFVAWQREQLCKGFSESVMGQISPLAMRDAGPSFRCTQVSVLKPAALMLFAAGNHIPALLLPPLPSLCPPSVPLHPG